jgi:hypothetical protein
MNNRAITGFVTAAGTLILRNITQGRPKMKLRGEGYIFFDASSLFNRVMKDKLYVQANSGETVHFFRYDMRQAERDFHTLAMEV